MSAPVGTFTAQFHRIKSEDSDYCSSSKSKPGAAVFVASFPCQGLRPGASSRLSRHSSGAPLVPSFFARRATKMGGNLIDVTEHTAAMELTPAGNGQPAGASTVALNGQHEKLILGPRPNEDVPVFVMLPLDTVNAEGVFRYAASRWFVTALQKLRDSGIHGVAVDVWWGAVERRPRRYDWSGYRQLFDLVASLGLKLQVVMAFHACGGNVGDNAEVPLPAWVVAAGERDPDLFFTDRPRELSRGQRNQECISIFAVDDPGLLKGRSPLQCYADFMRAFRDEFYPDLGSLVEDIVVGTGPCGELRYPSYPEPNGWRFPGIGEFQCYDRRALASLARAAAAVGQPDWGNAGPHDAGTYNSNPEQTGFFRGWGGRWDTDYGRFFLGWYSQALLEHGDRMLRTASSVFNVARQSNGAQGPGPLVGGLATAVVSPLGDGNNDTGGQDSFPFRQGSGGSSGGACSLQTAGPSSSGSLDVLMQQPYAAEPRQQAAPLPSPSVGSTPATAGVGLSSRPPSYSSFRSSSVSEGLNALEDWSWPSPSGPPVQLTLKIAGVHWWYRTRSHAAELTAGYYNAEGHSGYEPIVGICALYGACLTLTCVEMCDSQHPPEALCGPEGLLRQVREAAASAGVPLGGENALPCFMPNVIDEVALQRVVYNTQPWGTPLQQGAGAQDDGTLGIPVPPSGVISIAETATPAGSIPQASDAPSTALQPGSAALEGTYSNKNDAKVRKERLYGLFVCFGGPLSKSTYYSFISNMQLPPMRSFTFLRLTREMISPSYLEQWRRFMALMAHNARRFKTSPGWRINMGLQQ